MKNKAKVEQTVVNVKVMIHFSRDGHPFYTVAVERPRKIGFFARKAMMSKVHGRMGASSLIYALTQDSVLEAISPVKGVIR